MEFKINRALTTMGICAVVLSGVVAQPLMSASAKTQVAQTETPPRTITVVGIGKASSTPDIPSIALNITGEDIRLRDTAALVQELLPAARIEMRPGSSARYIDGLDAEAAAREIGYRPQFTLREGLRLTLNALRGHPERNL